MKQLKYQILRVKPEGFTQTLLSVLQGKHQIHGVALCGLYHGIAVTMVVQNWSCTVHV